MHRRRSIPILAATLIATATAPAGATEGATDKPTTLTASPDAGSISYDKGLHISAPGGWFAAKPGGRLQLRSVTEDDGQSTSENEIKRARVFVKGHLLSKALQYGFQADFAEGAYELKDAYLDISLTKSFAIRAGHFKRAYSRQQLNSSGSTELTDRAITDKAFAPGRDWGLAIHNFGWKSPGFEYSLGIFNGKGEEAYLFEDFSDEIAPAAVARLAYASSKMKGYSEADLEGGDLRFGVGASVNTDLGKTTTGWRGELDGIAKLHGFSASGAVYGRTSVGDQRSVGMHAQLGYVIAQMVQPAVRYAVVGGNDANDDKHEAVGGISLYLWKHRLKLQTEAGAIFEQQPGNDATTWVARSQFQVIL